MDGHRFDDLIRSWNVSRRPLLAGGLAVAGGWLSRALIAARKNRRKRTKLKRNAFGCVSVGGNCSGNDANCCSGICQGKKPKKGKKDTSQCVAHDVGICTPDSNICTLEGVYTCNPSNSACGCLGTTGNATFCSDTSGEPASHCRDCRKDSDCQEEFGPGAACVFLEELCSIYCADTGHTACYPPCV